MTKKLTVSLLAVLFLNVVSQAQTKNQQELERKLQATFCACFGDSVDVNDEKSGLERERACRAKFFEAHKAAFDSILTQEPARFGPLAEFEKDHLLDDDMMTNSTAYFMKNCSTFHQSMLNRKNVYHQFFREQKNNGRLKTIQDYVAKAVSQESDKEQNRRTAEYYRQCGNVLRI